MLNILLIVQIVISILLVIVILLQRTGADGLSGLASGNNMGVVSARAAANFLTRTTMVLAAIFMINSLVLANLSGKVGATTKTIEQELESSTNKANPEATSLPVAQ